jgi:hypothetical protein
MAVMLAWELLQICTTEICEREHMNNPNLFRRCED